MVFELQDAAVTFTGQSFNGYNEARDPKFNKLYMINTTYTELCVFFDPTFNFYFYPLDVWLSNCVISRLPKKYLNAIPMVLYVLMLSWGGFYPSRALGRIYLFFVQKNDRFLMETLVKKPWLKTESVHIAILYFSCSFILT